MSRGMRGRLPPRSVVKVSLFPENNILVLCSTCNGNSTRVIKLCLVPNCLPSASLVGIRAAVNILPSHRNLYPKEFNPYLIIDANQKGRRAEPLPYDAVAVVVYVQFP